MKWLSISGLPIAALALGGAAPAGGGRDIVLFGAHWCAPCMAEYGELPTLVTAAAPDRIVLAWIDRPLAPMPTVAGSIGGLPPEDARRLALKIAGEGYGLPFAAMLDARGRACAVVAGPLRAAQVASLRTRCATRDSRPD